MTFFPRLELRESNDDDEVEDEDEADFFDAADDVVDEEDVDGERFFCDFNASRVELPFRLRDRDEDEVVLRLVDFLKSKKKKEIKQMYCTVYHKTFAYTFFSTFMSVLG